MNICDEELPLLAAADASCVDSWIGPSPRNAGQQCYAARQRLQRELTVISSKYHFAAMQAAPCQHLGSSMHRGQKEKKNIGSSQRQLLTLARSTSGEVCEYFFFFLLLPHCTLTFGVYVTQNGGGKSGSGLLSHRLQFLCLLTGTQTLLQSKKSGRRSVYPFQR